MKNLAIITEAVATAEIRHVNNSIAADHISADDSKHIVLLGRFKVEKEIYEQVVYRATVIRRHLLKGVHYEPEDLIWGSLHEGFGASTHPDAVLCLKNLAAEPDSWLREVDWGTFELIDSENSK